MSAIVCIPLPDGRWLSMTQEAFDEALLAGQALNPPHNALSPSTSGDVLLDASGLASHLNVPVSWVAEQARRDALPVIKLGKYVRFSLSAVLAFLTTTQDVRIVHARGAANPLKQKPEVGALRIRNSGDRAGLSRPGTGAKEVR